MKALFGVVSLLVVLALVATLGLRQLRAVRQAQAVPAAGAVGVPSAPQMSGSGTLGQQSVEIQNRVADDVAKAINRADERRQEADKP